MIVLPVYCFSVAYSLQILSGGNVETAFYQALAVSYTDIISW